MESEKKQLTVSDHSSNERKKWVMQQYLACRYPADIKQEYITVYGLTEHSFEKDVTWSNAQIKAYGERSTEKVIEDHSNYLLDVYRHCREVGDSGNAIKALKTRQELLSVGGVKAKNVSFNQTINHNLQLPTMSVDEIRNLLGKRDEQNTVIDITPTE